MEYNIAVVLVRLANNEITRTIPLAPRHLGDIRFNRICNLFGWEGFRELALDYTPLMLFPIEIANAQENETICEPEHTQAHCTASEVLQSDFETCGGLMGSPIFCSDSISGIVVRDNFCQNFPNASASFLPIADFTDWINQVSAAKRTYGLHMALLLASLVASFKTHFK